MLAIILVILVLFVWSIPGAILARGLYSNAVREIRSKPVTLVPPKPPRPKIKVHEMLHTSYPNKCSYLKTESAAACNCKYRDDWENLKNEWFEYDEWMANYGHIKNGVVSEPSVNIIPIVLSVPFWPIALMTLYIQGGAKNIPDYRAIERMEQELRELN